VHSLFDEIVVDIDTRRITSFKLKPWAEQFLIVRASLYDAEKHKNQPENGAGSTFQGSVYSDAPTGIPHYGSRQAFPREGCAPVLAL
jgi:hypothetical protein